MKAKILINYSNKFSFTCSLQKQFLNIFNISDNILTKQNNKRNDQNYN